MVTRGAERISPIQLRQGIELLTADRWHETLNAAIWFRDWEALISRLSDDLVIGLYTVLRQA